MPTYTISDPQTGKTLKIQGDSPPTEKELDEIFAAEAPANTPAPVAPAPANLPRPDTKTGPTARMDPFARTGFLMGTPQGQEAMATTAQTVKNLGFEGGGATLGQIAGAPFAEFGGVQAGGAVGGFLGNTAAQLTTPGKDYSFGESLAAGAAGMVPGASLVKAGAKTVAQQAGKYAAANVLGANVESLAEGRGLAPISTDIMAAVGGAAAAPLSKYIDKGMRSEAARVAASQDSVRRETLKAGRELGLVIPPAAVAPNAVNETLQSVAGKAATAQEAILRNQPKVNAAVRSEIGLPSDAPISPISLNTARFEPNIVYEEVSKLTPAAGPLLENFKTATAEANIYRQAYRASIEAGKRNPALLEQAQAQDLIADQMRKALEKEANSPGANTRNARDIMDRFDAARTKLAKIGLAERSLNLGSGDIDPKIIGQALEHGEKLTGAFKTIGRFENAFGRYIKDASTTPPSGVDYLKMVGKFGLGGGAGYAAGGVPGAVAGTVAMAAAERGSRNAILSPFYQRNMAQPFYGAVTEDVPAALARFGTMSATRKEEPFSFMLPVSR